MSVVINQECPEQVSTYMYSYPDYCWLKVGLLGLVQHYGKNSDIDYSASHFLKYSIRFQFPLFPDNSKFLNILNNFGQPFGSTIWSTCFQDSHCLSGLHLGLCLWQAIFFFNWIKDSLNSTIKKKFHTWFHIITWNPFLNHLPLYCPYLWLLPTGNH